jgi:VanZ family protein
MTASLTFPAWAIRTGVALSLIAAVVVAIATLIPAPSGPPRIPHLDKGFHALGFFGITLPAALVLPRRAWVVAGLALALGGVIEVIQPSVGRGAEWADFAANTLGVACALWLAAALRPRLVGWLAPRA